MLAFPIPPALLRMLTFAGQNSNNIDFLFTGKTLGHKSDIADGSLRGWEFRQFNNLVGDYCVSPRFLDAVAVGCFAHLWRLRRCTSLSTATLFLVNFATVMIPSL